MVQFRRTQVPKSTYYALAQAHAAPMNTWRCTSTGQGVFNELHLADVAPMGRWPWCCTHTDQDGSNVLNLEWIPVVFAEFQHPQDSRNTYYAHGHAHVDQVDKRPWRCTSTGHDDSKEVDFESICPVIGEFERLQGFRSVYDVRGHADGKWPCRCTCTEQDGSSNSAKWLLGYGVRKFEPDGRTVGRNGARRVWSLTGWYM